MEATAVVERLVDIGVFERVGDGEEYVLRPEVRRRVVDHRSALNDANVDAVRERLEPFVDDPEYRSVLAERAGDVPRLVARFLALRETFGDLDHDVSLRVALALKRFGDDPPREDGAPHPFLPIRAGDLGAIAALSGPSIAYIWREQCPACDDLREMFEDLFADGSPPDLTLLSIYGPDDPRYLKDTFDVVGGPTTLFMRDGRVDARFAGAPDRRALEREIERLRELAG